MLLIPTVPPTGDEAQLSLEPITILDRKLVKKHFSPLTMVLVQGSNTETLYLWMPFGGPTCSNISRISTLEVKVYFKRWGMIGGRSEVAFRELVRDIGDKP